MTHALKKTVLLCAAAMSGAGIAADTPVTFFPVLVFRSGPYAMVCHGPTASSTI
jgi:hypothetical protein